MENMPVHIEDKLSASTDVRLVNPDVANDSNGPGSARAGICEVVLLFLI